MKDSDDCTFTFTSKGKCLSHDSLTSVLMPFFPGAEFLSLSLLYWDVQRTNEFPLYPSSLYSIVVPLCKWLIIKVPWLRQMVLLVLQLHSELHTEARQRILLSGGADVNLGAAVLSGDKYHPAANGEWLPACVTEFSQGRAGVVQVLLPKTIGRSYR